MIQDAVYDFQLEATFADERMAELDRQLALLLSTVAGSMPLERELGLHIDFVDMPIGTVKSLYTAEVTRKVAQFIPWVRVQEISWTQSEAGKLTPKVVITNA